MSAVCDGCLSSDQPQTRGGVVGEMNETLQLWSVAGTWFAGFCTLAAVVFSLWLAYNKDKIKLSVKVEKIARKENASPFPFEGCWIRVVNKGSMPAQITKIGWQVGSRKNMYFISDEEESGVIRQMLTAGQDKEYFLGAYELFMSAKIKNLDNNEILKNINPLYVVVCVAANEQPFKAKVSDNMIKELIQMWYEDLELKNET